MLQVQRVSKAHGDQIVLEDVSITISPGDRIGLTGPNGSGKTTLLNIITGEEPPDSGQARKSGAVTVGLLPQEIVPGNLNTAIEEIITGFPVYERYKSLLATDSDQVDHEELIRVQDEVELTVGFDFEAKAREILAGLGFGGRQMNQPLEHLSGGFRMRVQLARLLLGRPDLLLLDEPTNHLDMESTLWLEQFLQGFRGAMIVITHDRYFLNSLASRIAHLERGKLSVVKGNYEDFLVQQEQEENYLRQEFDKQQKEIRHLQSYIDKYIGQPKRARMVGSRKKMLARLEETKLPDPPEKPIHIQLPSAKPSGKQVILSDHVSKAYDSVTLYQDVKLTISRGEKIALVGPNGSGKTTLLKLMAKDISPDTGTVEYGHRVEPFYYTQYHLEQLDPTKTVLQEAYSCAGKHTAQTIRNILGAFRFSGDTVDKVVAALSGGEKARVALCKMLLTAPNLLLMDEPTNHLDMASREVLIDALCQYDGTLIFISHDRHFIDEVANKVIEVYQGELTNYPGNFRDYFPQSRFLADFGKGLRKKTSTSDKGAAAKKREDERNRKRREAEERNRRYQKTKKFREKVEKIEVTIDQLEKQKERLHGELAHPDIYDDYSKYMKLLSKSEDLERRLTGLYKEWETLSRKIEEVDPS